MIRITGGQWRGRYIDSPKNAAIRPTVGLVRESLFSRIQHQLQDARFLDLFAGSGLMGIEALSRGAAYVLAIEKNPAHVRLIQRNYEKLGIPSALYQVWQQDVLKTTGMSNPQAPFDLAFLDPPYGFPELETLAQALFQNQWVSSLIVVEQGSREPALPGADMKQFGDTRLNFLAR